MRLKKKIMIPVLVLVLVLVGGVGYSMTKKKNSKKPKINGTIYVLPKSFTLNLRGGQYATLTVALLLPPTEAVGATNPQDPPPTGFGDLPDAAAIRAIITNDITGDSEQALISKTGRHKLEQRILSNINGQTDTRATAIYFTDLAVQ